MPPHRARTLARPIAALVVALAAGCAGGAGTPLAIEGQPAAVEAHVVRVVDGDTIEVRIGALETSVRFLGVDTPERARGGRPAEPLYEEARAFVASALAGGTANLLADPLADDRDRYGRLLRHVVLPGGATLGEALIREGLGAALTEWPHARADAFVAAETEARRAGRGMWAPERVRRVPWSEAPAHEGAVVEIVGKVVATRCLPTLCFLNFDPDYRRHVTAVVLDADRHRFEDDPALRFRGREVRVTGRVTIFRDRPQIVLHAPDQIVEVGG